MSGPSTYVPKSAFAKWFEARLPIGGLIHSSFIAYPTPRNLNYMWTFGGILSFMLVAQIVTGISVGLALGLALFNQGYVKGYDSVLGQVVLVVVVGLYGAGFVWMRRLAAIDGADRLLRGSPASTAEGRS